VAQHRCPVDQRIGPADDGSARTQVRGVRHRRDRRPVRRRPLDGVPGSRPCRRQATSPSRIAGGTYALSRVPMSVPGCTVYRTGRGRSRKGRRPPRRQRSSSCCIVRAPRSALVTPRVRNCARHREVGHRQSRFFGERDQPLYCVQAPLVIEGRDHLRASDVAAYETSVCTIGEPSGAAVLPTRTAAVPD
jgi:hypothetical protein